VKRIGAYEAKTHLPRLLDEVARGARVVITKRGVPVADLVPTARTTGSAADAVAALRAFRAAHPLSGVTIRELIDEGRR
jgi:prevent-host-death family protein